MKRKWNILWLLGLLILASCGDDDDDDNNDDTDSGSLSDVEFSIGGDGVQPIDQTVIDNLTNTANSTSDPNAFQIAAQLQVANALSA